MPEKLDENEPYQEDPSEEKVTADFYIPENNFVQLDRRLYDYYMPLIGSIGIMLYGAIGRLYNAEKGYAFPSLDRLVKSTGLARNTIKKYLRILAGEEEGYEYIQLITIKRSNRKGQSTKYFLREPCVTPEVLEALEKKGCKPLIKSKHLAGVERTNKGPADDSQKNKESKFRGQEMTPKNKKGSTDDTLGSNGDLHKDQSLTPKESKISKESKKREQQQVEPDPALPPSKQEIGRSKDVVVDSHKNGETGRLITELCQVVNITEAKARAFVKKFDSNIVTKQLQNLETQLKARKNIKSPIAWLTEACKRNYVRQEHPKHNEWKEELDKKRVSRVEIEREEDSYFEKRRISKAGELQRIDGAIGRLRGLIIEHGGDPDEYVGAGTKNAPPF